MVLELDDEIANIFHASTAVGGKCIIIIDLVVIRFLVSLLCMHAAKHPPLLISHASDHLEVSCSIS